MAEAFAMLDDQALVNSLGYNMVEAESDSKESNLEQCHNYICKKFEHCQLDWKGRVHSLWKRVEQTGS
jgi:hypothetical protein